MFIYESFFITSIPFIIMFTFPDTFMYSQANADEIL